MIIIIFVRKEKSVGNSARTTGGKISGRSMSIFSIIIANLMYGTWDACGMRRINTITLQVVKNTLQQCNVRLSFMPLRLFPQKINPPLPPPLPDLGVFFLLLK